MKKRDHPSTPPRRRQWPWAIALLTAPALLAGALAVRTVTSFDVGYHLAYGEEFLNHGRIVRTNQFMYTRLDGNILSDPRAFGPGAWYSPRDGKYHFINANWLSQVLMAAGHRLGGMTALTACQVALVAGLFALVVATMRRGRLGWEWAAVGAALTMMGAYSRFNLRPELFGYVVLAGQWCILVRGDIGWRGVAGLAALQMLAVNLHSYFLLGPALAGTWLADALLRWYWHRIRRRPVPEGLARRLKIFAAATGGMLLATVVNPGTVRGALMPVETLIYVFREGISGRVPGAPGAAHPWAFITELISPLSPEFFRTAAGMTYAAALALSAAAAVAALLRRQWGWALALVGIAATSLGMQRNAAPACLILIPLALVVLGDGWRAWATRRGGGPHRPGRLVARAAGILGWAGAAALVLLVTTQRLYFHERRPWRFGVGVSPLALPVGPAEWINRHRPPGRIFCDTDTSSNLLYLTRQQYEVPILTNTWSHPPYVMQWVLQIVAGQREFPPIADNYGINTVVLRSSLTCAPLMKALDNSADWTLVQIHPRWVVFVRTSGPTAELARQDRIRPWSADPDRLFRLALRSDSVKAYALHCAAQVPYRLAWGDRKIGGGDINQPDRGMLERQTAWADVAIELWRKALQEDAGYREAVLGLGSCLGLRGTAQALLVSWYHQRNDRIEVEVKKTVDWSDPGKAAREFTRAILNHEEFQSNARQIRDLKARALADWSAARVVVTEAMKSAPGVRSYGEFLETLRQQTEAFRQGKIHVPTIIP